MGKEGDGWAGSFRSDKLRSSLVGIPSVCAVIVPGQTFLEQLLPSDTPLGSDREHWTGRTRGGWC